MSYFTDVIKQDSRYDTRLRCADLTMLEPVTRAAVLGIIDDARAAGVELMPWETYRSKQRQLALYERGASKLRDVGVHHYGLACDLVMLVDGEPSWKGDFAALGKLAKVHGLIWGGDWGTPGKRHSFVDAVHVQRIAVNRQRALFDGEWYPDDDYDPYVDLAGGVAA